VKDRVLQVAEVVNAAAVELPHRDGNDDQEHDRPKAEAFVPGRRAPSVPTPTHAQDQSKPLVPQPQELTSLNVRRTVSRASPF
jgi:hypothetical protein